MIILTGAALIYKNMIDDKKGRKLFEFPTFFMLKYFFQLFDSYFLGNIFWKSFLID